MFKKAIISITALIMLSGGISVSAEPVISRVYGDVTGDNIFDIKDISAMSEYITYGGETAIENLDFNGDNEVNLVDYMIMKKAIINHDMGIRFGFPIYREEHRNYTSNGIDVSKWQFDIDWEAVKASGIEFVMIKAGEGVEEEVNFRKNIEGAKKVGLQCGVYWFANASTIEEALTEAEACVKTISGYQLEYPVVYDFEYRTLENNTAEGNPQLITDMINEFMLSIQHSGYYPMIYTNLDFLKNYLDESRLNPIDLWYANYHIEEPDIDCMMWQRSCTGQIDGINTDVDLDISYMNYPQIMQEYGWNGF